MSYKHLGKMSCILIQKIVFVIDHIEFLGFIVSSKGVHVDEQKVAPVQNWPTPIKDLLASVSSPKEKLFWEIVAWKIPLKTCEP